MLPYPCLYAGDFNCQQTDWRYNYTNPDGECLADCSAKEKFFFLYNPKNAPSFSFGRWNTGTNPNLAFVTEDLNSSQLDRRTLEKFLSLHH